jgi:hypothetical protein
MQLIKTQPQGVRQAGNRQERRRRHTTVLQTANRIDGYGGFAREVGCRASALLPLRRDKGSKLPTMVSIFG